MVSGAAAPLCMHANVAVDMIGVSASIELLMRALRKSRLMFALLTLAVSCFNAPSRQACRNGFGEASVSGRTPASYYLDVYERQCSGEHTWEVSIRHQGEAEGVGLGNAFRGRARDADGFRVRAIWVDSGVVIVPDSTLVVLKRDTLVRGIRIFYAPPGWRLQRRPQAVGERERGV